MGKKRNTSDKEPNGTTVVMSGKEIESRLSDAGSNEELDDIHRTLRQEGVPDGSIRAAINRMRNKGKLVFQTSIDKGTNGSMADSHDPMPLEMIISEMSLPLEIAKETSNTDLVRGWNLGSRHTAKMIVGGVRIAQELSRMGIAQASPIIRMAGEMDKAKGASAKEAGTAAAESMAQQMIEYLQSKEQKTDKVDIASVNDPMKGMMARQMERMMDRMQDTMFTQPGQPVKPSLPITWKDERK